MADTKISAMTTVDALAAGDLLPITDVSGATNADKVRNATAAQVATFVNSTTGSAVSAMTAASASDGTELHYVVQGGADRKMTGAQIQTFAIAATNTQKIWVPAGGMIPRNTNGPAQGSGETTTNKVMRRTLDFDTTTAEYAQWDDFLPPSWNAGTVTFFAVWSHPSTSTNFGVCWKVSGRCYADDDAQDQATGTGQTSVDTGGTTDDIYISPASSAITLGGTPAASRMVQFEVSRVPSDGGDTMAVDARLHGVVVVYTYSSLSDS